MAQTAFTYVNPSELERPKRLYSPKRPDQKPPEWWHRPAWAKSFTETYECLQRYDFVSVKYPVYEASKWPQRPQRRGGERRKLWVAQDRIIDDYEATFTVRDHVNLRQGKRTKYGFPDYDIRTRTVQLRDWWNYHLATESEKAAFVTEERVQPCQ